MLLTIMNIVLAIAFLAAGLPKVLGMEKAVQSVTEFGYGIGFARLVGAGEAAGAAALLWGLSDPTGTIIGCALLIAIMLGALYSHLAVGKDPFARWAPAAALLIIAAVRLGLAL